MQLVNVDDLLPRLGQLIADLREEDWDTAELEAEFGDGLHDFTLCYVKSGSDPDYVGLIDIPDALEELDSLFEDMWQRFVDHGDEPWTRAIFSLSSAGKATLQFKYREASE